MKPYVRRNKTDRLDTEALLEAARCAGIQPVPVKTPEQQALQALHRVRTQWQRTSDLSHGQDSAFSLIAGSSPNTVVRVFTETPSPAAMTILTLSNTSAAAFSLCHPISGPASIPEFRVWRPSSTASYAGRRLLGRVFLLRLAEGHLIQSWFGTMLARIWALPPARNVQPVCADVGRRNGTRAENSPRNADRAPARPLWKGDGCKFHDAWSSTRKNVSQPASIEDSMLPGLVGQMETLPASASPGRCVIARRGLSRIS